MVKAGDRIIQQVGGGRLPPPDWSRWSTSKSSFSELRQSFVLRCGQHFGLDPNFEDLSAGWHLGPSDRHPPPPLEFVLYIPSGSEPPCQIRGQMRNARNWWIPTAIVLLHQVKCFWSHKWSQRQWCHPPSKSVRFIQILNEPKCQILILESANSCFKF